MMNWFRSTAHLWRCPLSRAYHDPRVLMRALCDMPSPPTIDSVRRAMGLTRIVGTDGSGYSESQVEDAYAAFLAWYEGKGETARTSPTSAPSTDSPTS